MRIYERMCVRTQVQTELCKEKRLLEYKRDAYGKL